MTDSTLKGRLAQVEEGIAEACHSAGRARSDVRLIAVTKTHPLEAVQAAYALGLRDFGESYAQELLQKREDLGTSLPDVRWHFIGRVQTNKAKILARADLVHGVGSLAHAEALARRADPERGVALLAQVNVSGEEQKNGFSFDDLRRDLQALLQVPAARLCGLMAILERGEQGDAARERFAAVRLLRDELEGRAAVSLPVLSMGMTADFREAILEGATHIRVGTALFGPRAPR